MYSLTDDTNSTIRTHHQEFVKTMVLTTLDSNPNSRAVSGKIFAELLSYKNKVISIVDVTQWYYFH